ncbi:unnamed protein product, partial [Ectocarpus sp. 8 AP-2014]
MFANVLPPHDKSVCQRKINRPQSLYLSIPAQHVNENNTSIVSSTPWIPRVDQHSRGFDFEYQIKMHRRGCGLIGPSGSNMTSLGGYGCKNFNCNLRLSPTNRLKAGMTNPCSLERRGPNWTAGCQEGCVPTRENFPPPWNTHPFSTCTQRSVKY